MTVPLIAIRGHGQIRLVYRKPSMHPLDIGGIEAAIAADPPAFPRFHLWRHKQLAEQLGLMSPPHSGSDRGSDV